MQSGGDNGAGNMQDGDLWLRYKLKNTTLTSSVVCLKSLVRCQSILANNHVWSPTKVRALLKGLG